MSIKNKLIPRKAVNMMKKLPGRKKQPLSDEERQRAEEELRKIEATLKSAGVKTDGISDDQLALIAEGIQQMLDEDDTIKNQPEKPPKPSTQIEVKGDVGAVANIGDGTMTVSGGVGGRDHKTITTTTYIEHAETIIISGDGQLPTGINPAIDEAEQSYLRRMLLTASRVPLGQLDLKAGSQGQSVPELRLNAVYVPLDTTLTRPAVGGQSGERTNIPVLDAAIRNRRLVILGDPGAGKTTFTNYLIFTLAAARLYPDASHIERLNVPKQRGQRAANWKYGPLLPVRVDLRIFAHDIPEKTQRGAAELVWQHIFKRLEFFNQKEFARKLQQALWDGKGLVLFDGLDEISDKTKRKVVSQSLSDFAEMYSQTTSRFIVTCRVLSYTDPDWKLTGFPTVTLAPLSMENADRFIDNWYAALGRTEMMSQEESRSKAESLKAESVSLDDLKQNPLLLTVIALVHTHRNFLKTGRVRLYQDCIHLLLWEWQRTKQIAPGQWEPGILEELDTREERLFNGLCEVAFHAQGSGDGKENADIPRADLFRVLQSYLDDDWGKAQKFGEYVERRAGLLINRGKTKNGDELYAFLHRGFQEFLAGHHLVVGRDFPRNAADLAAKGDTWHEVLLLAVGHLVYNFKQVTPVLDTISLLCPPVPPKDESEWRLIWLAGQMLHTVGRSAAEQDKHRGALAVPRLISRLVELAQDGHLSVRERAQAADTLGLLGDPRKGVCSEVPEMITLKGGMFEVGQDAEKHRVKVKTFALGRYPVTNAQFRSFVKKGYDTDYHWTEEGIAWRNRVSDKQGLLDDPVWGIDNRPVVKVTWHEAVAYANWLRATLGKPFRLPTEIEWERAAAGKEQRRYPFGKEAKSGIANIQKVGIGQTTTVGIFPSDITPEGIADMGGNVWEWCSSQDKAYPYKVGDGREDLSVTGARMLRGGGYDGARETLFSTYRRPATPSARVSLIGFRVACDE